MRNLRSILILLLGVASVGAFSALAATAQRPPPPEVIPPPTVLMPAMDRSRPHVLNDRLDHSFCDYPALALRTRLEGCCRMKVQIGTDGRAGKMTGECTDPIFLEPSRACLAPQAYLPALKKGKPVRGSGDVVVQYSMASSPSFFDFLRRRKPKPEPDICKPRPDDLIASLGRRRAG